MAGGIEIVSSIQDHFGYYDNLAYLKGNLGNTVQFQGLVYNFAPNTFVFDKKARIYDFTRSAGSTIRDSMTRQLAQSLFPAVLPQLQQPSQPVNEQRIREAFDRLYNYYAYKDYLTLVPSKRTESMNMLIFNPNNYVALVTFSSDARRTGVSQFTVDVSLTWQRYTYFQKRNSNFNVVLLGLQNLHMQ